MESRLKGGTPTNPTRNEAQWYTQMSRLLASLFVLAGLALPMLAWADADKPCKLQFRTRERLPVKPGAKEFKSLEHTVSWDPQKIALIVVDMWDDHWCQGAAARVVELAGPMNK